MASDDPKNAAIEPTRLPEATPADFAETLFHRVAHEDLLPYTAANLEALATDAFQHLSVPRQSGPDIRLTDHEFAVAGQAREITVLEIVNDNMPFLLDSTLAALTAQGLEPRLVAHPIVAVERSRTGQLLQFESGAGAADQPALERESLIHIHLDRLDDPAARDRLTDALRKTYADVAVAVDDRAGMWARIDEVIRAYRTNPPPLAEDEVAEALAFLRWVRADNFLFLGVCEYRLPDGDMAADPVQGSRLGLLRDPDVRVLRRGSELVVMTPEIRAFLARPHLLIIAKANVKSRVHRHAYLDYVGIKMFSRSGELEGELRLVGLFAASAYTSTVGAVPYLRHKVAKAVARANFDRTSYAGRALLAVMETYPRDELFQIDEDTLYRFAIEIMNLSERPRICALVRPDEFDRFISVLVFVPKERYDTAVRLRVGAYLAEMFQGRLSAAYPAYPEGPLARTHFIIGRDEGIVPKVDPAVIEAGIAAIARTWSDALRDELRRSVGGARARELSERYATAFSAAYREAFPVERALLDIDILEHLTPERPRSVRLYREPGEKPARVDLCLFSLDTELPLSERVPVLENFGFRVLNERTYGIDAGGAARVWLHEMALERASGAPIDIEAISAPVEAAQLALFRGIAESDGFNRLILEAGLEWRDVALLRTFGRYLRQIRSPYGQEYLAGTLARYGAIARRIVALFHARFDPALTDTDRTDRTDREAAIRTEIDAALADVASLDDDRILRRFVNLVDATVRTDYFQTGADGEPRTTIACKFECRRVDDMPLPRPLFEIFVYSPRVEGLHLRFGKVARGGLRWSDRPQDFRTEVLGLAKAQQVKNAVIVPVGAKGGFVPKRLPPITDRQAWMAEGTASYRIFVDALLQLTDDIGPADIVPPRDMVRHDADDPYLVVAADKGTATFSDTANAISLSRGFWLGDAFASGGSHGYDHKVMGITARGAWEAVKRHFREIDIDIQREPVTVVGVGDMSGDVFGNGMLLSHTIRLVAAFDHRDIFLDPDPDLEAAWAERSRLFGLPRSSWADYDRSLISKGGGVFARSLKSIDLAPEMQAILGLDRSKVTPAELMEAILKAQVDLLWFGGIGTYIRASTETDAEAGDRANDAIRITGADVRVKVIGEGANLGVTQRGRIEAARHGVRLNTDAIDNSAGVNTSDVEVNIKIALATPQRDGALDDAARNALLVEMTDEVGTLVLRNNYLQSLALSLAERRGAAGIDFAQRLMQMLEQEGRLNRAVEFLPDAAALAERARLDEGLTRPELAVLLAYGKLALHDAVLDSAVPDDPYLARELERYFPVLLRERFPDAIAAHRLRRDLIATGLANAIVNHAGAAIVPRLVDETGADAPTIAAAYAAATDSFGLSALNEAVNALDNQVQGGLQLGLYASLQDLLTDRMVWFIRNVELTGGALEAVVAHYRAGIETVARGLEHALPAAAAETWATRTANLVEQGVPHDLARRLASLADLAAAADIVLVAGQTGRDAQAVAAIHFAVEETFGLRAILEAGRAITVTDHFDRLALNRAFDAIDSAHRRLTTQVVASGGDKAAAIDAWCNNRIGPVKRMREAVEGIVASGLTLSKLIVVASLLADLTKDHVAKTVKTAM